MQRAIGIGVMALVMLGSLTLKSEAFYREVPGAEFRFEILEPEEIWNQYQEASWFRLGIAYLENERFIEAINAFHFAIEYNPKLYEAHQNIGYAYFLMGDFQQSALALANAIKLEPSAAHAHHLLGVIFTIYAMYDSAILELERAATISPENALIQYDLGFALEFYGSLSKAKESYENALKINPEFKEAQSRLDGVVEKISTEHKSDQVDLNKKGTL